MSACLSESVLALLATAAKRVAAMRQLRSPWLQCALSYFRRPLTPAFTRSALSAQAEWHALTAPATTVKLRQAVGDCSVADVLEAALNHGGGSLAGGTSSDGSWEML